MGFIFVTPENTFNEHKMWHFLFMPPLPADLGEGGSYLLCKIANVKREKMG